jgi:DNA-binding transcriptional MerR regulator/methylmalonyl-CoA mutase cobalamin-binding subunit
MTDQVHTIAEVAQDTGIQKDTLRVWERRYGFPVPVRGAGEERAYDDAQLTRLRLIKRLLDSGMRAGQVVAQPLEALNSLVLAACQPSAAHAVSATVEPLLMLLLQHQRKNLHDSLMLHVETSGLGQAIESIISPMAARVGELWMRGELALYEEHLFTSVVQGVLLQGMAQLPLQGAGDSPKVVLTTLNHEPHALGLLMAECMFAQMGCDRISLGPRTPAVDLAQAARVMQADIVALSFSSHTSPKAALLGVTHLRDLLPSHIAIWAGGSASTLSQVKRANVARVFGVAQELLDAVTQWRLDAVQPQDRVKR